jgi:hypothetical protein
MSVTPLHGFCNRELLEELAKLRDRDVLLLLLDGTAIFGHLGRVEEWVISVVPPLSVTTPNLVQYRLPNPTMVSPLLVSQLSINFCDIAHIVEGPFSESPLATDDTPLFYEDISPVGPRTYRQRCELIDELTELRGQNAAYATLGGWIIAGQLDEVYDCIALISGATASLAPFIVAGTITILGPVFAGGFRFLTGTFRVWSNLKALTTIILP